MVGLTVTDKKGTSAVLRHTKTTTIAMDKVAGSITTLDANLNDVRHDTPLTTPIAMSNSAHVLIKEITSIYNQLKTFASLAPSTDLNALLSKLVELCASPHGERFACTILSTQGFDELCIQLRHLCANAEGELEKHWANRFLSATSEPLCTFPYHQNYVDLSRLECATVEAFLPRISPTHYPLPHKLAFIGSGPLPLTSFSLLDRYSDAVIHNIDRDANALQLSQSLAQRLNYADRMTFACEDITDEAPCSETDWAGFDVVFLAALVGMDTASKLAILSSLVRKLDSGTLILARSAHGMRSILYPVLELSEDLSCIGCEILAVVHPWTKVVNSVVVLRVKER